MPRRVSNPPNPWSSTHVEWLEAPPEARLEVFEEEARSVLAENDSPDVPFRWSVNPYRGCQHACAYCYARATHTYLDFGAGTDFDTKIVVKRNAPEVLRRQLARRSWKRAWIAFSGVTDCYQPLEASYGLTRACLEACLEFQNPVGIVTKSALVRRDVDLLTRFRRFSDPHVFLSIPFADDETARRIEPGVTSPAKRFETLRALSDAGLTTGVALAPLIPGLNDAQLPEILERAREAGARHAFLILLRLTRDVRPVFEERLRARFPGRAAKVLNALDEMRAGQPAGHEFGRRMVGAGPRWQAALDLFALHKRRLGYAEDAVETPAPDGRPEPSRVKTHQPDLFA
jgi:DNA repair photolyase